jgi:hypothetical protein
MSHPSTTSVIPPDQQPLKEYQQLRNSWFYRWPTLTLAAYLKGILAVWLGSWVLTGPVAASSFLLPQQWSLWGIVAGLAANFLLGLVLLRLYLGWIYVKQRLLSAEVVYEETGWYDIAVSAKSEGEVNQHRLIVQYQISPLLERIQRTFVWLAGGSFGAGLLGWWLSL